MSFKFLENSPARPVVKYWLALGVVLVFFQIFIGGVTRLTGSGLSITEWKIVTGTLPPLNQVDWKSEFLKYQATPQYQKINQGMSLSDFKFIYFWEYFHRLWARMMGFVFIIPFFYFLWKGWLSKKLIGRLGWVIGFSVVAASFGIIMVMSGLRDRPWVNAYKLSIHLTLGFSVFAFLLWALFHEFFPKVEILKKQDFRKLARWTFGIGLVQFIFGGLMSGMKAGLFFPTWPDMNGHLFAEVLFDKAQWNLINLEHYDTNAFAPALIQFLHRNTAYFLAVLVSYFSFKLWKGNTPQTRRLAILIFSAISLQVFLGVFTLINCKGSIPVLWGILHQAGGVVLLAILLYSNFLTRKVN